MPRSAAKNKRVFLDASVIVAAALSPSGGSFRCLHEAPLQGWQCLTSSYAMNEAYGALQRKRPDRVGILVELVGMSRMKIVRDANSREVEQASLVIDHKDAPILAASLKSRSTILLTLDQEHLFDPQLVRARLPIGMLTPGMFTQRYLV